MDFYGVSIRAKNAMKVMSIWIALPFLFLSCNNKRSNGAGTVTAEKKTAGNPYSQINAIPLPDGFERTPADTASFTAFLRNIRLKQSTTVYLYNGQPKANQLAQYALLDIGVGKTDLQQCADAVMRLRAEYLFARGFYQQIIFRDNANTAYTFVPPYSRSRFDTYLTRVFGMCGSASLSKQLMTVGHFADIAPGDVLIRGGFPGHAVIVMDVATNNAGKKIYLLAQSYMPAQDIHVLKNPANENLSPWYEVNDDPVIHTPEYTFTQAELKRW